MNERIKELAEQAGMSYYPKYRMWASAYHTEVEKFAELIVRECISQIAKEGDGHFSSTEWDEGYHAGLNVSQKVLKYFGV